MKCFDLQLNGAFGIDFSDPELTRDSFLRTAQRILERGVTRFLPTVITSSFDVYKRNLPLIASAVERAGLEYEIPGFHLEGPFISPEPGAVGAHDPANVIAPSTARLDELNAMADGKIKILTIAAEREGAKALADYAHTLGIVVSLGHQLASQEQIKSIGADALTHLGNGIPNMIDRHRNPIWSGLADDSLTAFIIADGHHLPYEVLKCFIRCKGMDKIIVTSDASSAAGLPPGQYRVLGNDAVLYENGLLYNPVKKCLVGSASLLVDCIKYLNEQQLMTEQEIEKTVWRNPHAILGLGVES